MACIKEMTASLNRQLQKYYYLKSLLSYGIVSPLDSQWRLTGLISHKCSNRIPGFYWYRLLVKLGPSRVGDGFIIIDPVQRYDTIEEFNVDSKAECVQLNLAHVARN